MVSSASGVVSVSIPDARACVAIALQLVICIARCVSGCWRGLMPGRTMCRSLRIFAIASDAKSKEVYWARRIDQGVCTAIMAWMCGSA